MRVINTTRDMKRLGKVVIVGMLGCHGAAAFILSGQRPGGRISSIHRSSSSSSRSPRWKVVSSGRPLPSMTTAGSHDESHDLHEDYAQTAKTEAASFWSAASTTAAACLATAVILSSSLPAGAGVVGGDFGSGSSLPWRGGAPMNTMMLVADEGDYTSPDGRADVSQMVSELKKADRADSVLNSMVKINDVVDADEDGLLENPFAKESIVKGLIDKRRAGGEAWDGNTETAFGILKRKLDPFNVVLLRPYLKIAPFLGGAYYLAVFFVQQKFRDFFPYAYFGAVAVFVAPALIIVLSN